MKKKVAWTWLIVSIIIFMTACSSNDSMKEEKGIYEVSTESSLSNDMGVEQDSSASEEAAMDEEVEVSKEVGKVSTNRMIIHQARLQLNVKDFEKAEQNIEKKVNEYGGYIVESNVYREDDESVSGNITVRIPEKHFQKFLTATEGEAADILERTVTGQDVTEQYVDLKSRVKSKRAVEERLLDFMGDAEKTEDLLKISSDLAAIQEEIEVIVGKMNYLENQTSYSTVEISMFENRVIVPGLDNKDLDTWDKTKKQLATSTNFLLAAGSGLIVFIIGNLPIFILLLLIGLGVYLAFIRKRIK
ncbi:DUF4349 domain-containing protein [Sporosarcina sp. Marseille-Q4063]|uniref:DUF4349 domain-containing protein n=1 Tax=Sporosarcina sp. Marseille-Q4063 TaxID=2810514 RepID=UPI002016675E|nr:DUF4349 domain-containing protein [Sporosarcina sp. Marseille-Q4063]